MLKVGKILSSHGLNGNVKVVSFFENPEDIFSYRVTDGSGNDLNYRKAGLTSKKDVFLVKFEHINSIEEAKMHNGVELFIDSNDLPPLAEGEFYLEDMIGMSVTDGDRNGVIDSLSNYGAGDILEIKWNGRGTECITYSKDLIKEVDKENRIIRIHPPSYI
jgi:16S rRNA processing protein RimM